MQAGERAGFESLMPLICHRARNHPGPAGAEPGGDTKGSKSKLTAARVLKAETSADYPWRANTYQTVMHGWARPYEPLLIIPGDLRAVLFHAIFGKVTGSVQSKMCLE